MSAEPAREIEYCLKQPHGLSPRVRWLRDYFFEGVKRSWNNQYTCWTTGAPWDVLYDELSYYIVPEVYAFLQVFRSSALQAAQPVKLDPEFWKWSLPERRAWFIREVMVECVPQEILPGDLVAGAAAVFASGSGNGKTQEDLTGPLYQEIGRLKMEVDWLKKKL